MVKKYVARPGCPLSKKDAKALALEVERLRAQGVRVNKHTLVQAAKNRRSPLHRFFDWNDKQAAHKYRLQFAQELIGMVMEIEVRTGKPARAYYTINHLEAEPGQKKRWFEPREFVLADTDSRGQISFDRYRTVKGLIEDVISLGLDREFLAWKRICAVVKQNPVGPVELKPKVKKKKKRKAG